MSRLFGVVCNDPERVACALAPARDALAAKAAPDGWGLAFYQGGEVLLQRHPKPLHATLDFYGHVRDLRTDYLVGHVREPGTQAKLENTQPYRYRSWVFAQSGSIEPFAAVQAGLLEHVPDFMRRNIRGQNDAEHVFHLFLSFLHDGGKLDDPNVRVLDVAQALRATIAMVDRLVVASGGTAARLNVIVTNGRILLGLRDGRPMWMRRTNGIVDCRVCGDADPDLRNDRRRTTHEHLRAVLVVSEPDRLGPQGWEEVPDDTIVGVSRDLQTSVYPRKAEG